MSSILVVDDDEELRALMAELLEGEGHGVMQASNGQEALEALRGSATPPALVLLDLMMPVMSGPELLELMAADATLARVPVVVVSALADAGDAPGVKRFLRKPVSLSALRDAIARFANAA